MDSKNFSLSPTFSAGLLLAMLNEVRGQIAAFEDAKSWPFREQHEQMRADLTEALCVTVSELS